MELALLVLTPATLRPKMKASPAVSAAGTHTFQHELYHLLISRVRLRLIDARACTFPRVRHSPISPLPLFRLRLQAAPARPLSSLLAGLRRREPRPPPPKPTRTAPCGPRISRSGRKALSRRPSSRSAAPISKDRLVFKA